MNRTKVSDNAIQTLVSNGCTVIVNENGVTKWYNKNNKIMKRINKWLVKHISINWNRKSD